MKIQNGQNLTTERSQRLVHADRLGSDVRESSRPRHIGLDKVDVSRVGETAARVVEGTLESRQERVNQLTKLVQAGQYSVDLSRLTESIIDHDSESDSIYAA